MATETIFIEGAPVTTLSELLRPDLRAVFVGINPSLTSVAAGHYWQGRHGRQRWLRLTAVGILPRLPAGREDDHAFTIGFGFADIVRRPTAAASELVRDELRRGAANLADRLRTSAPGVGTIVFVYKSAADVASNQLRACGFVCATMPGPYERRDDVERGMMLLRSVLS